MNRTREKSARRRGHIEHIATMILIIAVSVSLFSVVGNTVATCYATQATSGEVVIEPELPPESSSTAIMVHNDTIRATAVSIRKLDTTEGEKLTRLDGCVITQYDDDANYPQLMKNMLAKAQEDPTNATLYLQFAEVYECQSNLKVAETGEGEITHIFSRWNEDLDEMDKLLYETYPWFNYTEHDVVRLASIIHMEAGSDFVSDEHQRDVASVPLNRLFDPNFPGDTIDEIIDYPNQYPHTRDNRIYTQREWDNALYVVQHGPTTAGVYQANFVVSTATEVLKIYEYPDHSWVKPTYICR